MASTSEIPGTPTLDAIYSGIPSRLLDKAQRAKTLIYQGRTVQAITGERQLPVIPQGVSRTTFDKAIAELAQSLGDDNVEINDQPPKDGSWYMERYD